MKRLFSIIIVLCFTPMLLAQFESNTQPAPANPQPSPVGNYVPPSLPPRPAMALMGVNPDLLQRIQSDLNMELKQIQRALSFIDPQDSHLSQTLSTRQTEVLTQLKDITEQLKNAGIVTPDVIADETRLANGSPIVPATPDASPLRPAPTTQITTPTGVVDNNSPSPSQTRRPSQFTQVPSIMPADPIMSQDATALSNDTWDSPPSKELVLLRQTISEMRTEITSLRQDIKALETQIRLLNQNILLQTKTSVTGQ